MNTATEIELTKEAVDAYASKIGTFFLTKAAMILAGVYGKPGVWSVDFEGESVFVRQVAAQ